MRPVPAFLLLAVLTASGSCQSKIPPRTAWLQAPQTQGAHWDREHILTRVLAGIQLTGLTRAKVLALLGPPGYSAKSYPESGRIDFYRLSAANKSEFRIDYAIDDTLTGDFVEEEPCSCDLCTADAPPLAQTGTDRLMAESKTASHSFTIAEFEKLVGGSGRISASRDVKGGQLWLNYIETWRIAGTPHEFLLATGHVPSRDAPTPDVSSQPIDSWAVVSFAPACLARP